MHVFVCVTEFEILKQKLNRFIFVLTKKKKENKNNLHEQEKI